MFRKDVATFVRLYDVVGQIVDCGDVGLEKRSIFLRLLERLIRPDNYTAEVDLSDVTLVAVRQIDTGTHDIGLGNGRGVCARGNYVREMPGWHLETIADGLGHTPHTVRTTTLTGHTYDSRAP